MPVSQNGLQFPLHGHTLPCKMTHRTTAQTGNTGSDHLDPRDATGVPVFLCRPTWPVTIRSGTHGTGSACSSTYEIDRLGYGGWLEHSFFIVESAVGTGGILDGAVLGYSYSVGDATGTNPDISGGASWTGVMVGMSVTGTAARGNPVQGDADISIDLSNPATVGVSFTNIHDLKNESVLQPMNWSGIPMTDGGFRTGSDGNSVDGRFYGPNHEEVGGVFERDMVIGAFGGDRE